MSDGVGSALERGALPETLRDTLWAAMDDARAASSAFRPAVAAYVFDAGLSLLHAGLGGRDGPLDADATTLLTATWRLMLETVATRRFGVSDGRWRAAVDYPDRYYPTLWLDIVPRCLPALPPDARLDALAMLFNLGENLPGRGVANAVAARLVGDLDRLAHDPRGAIAAALDAVGLLAVSRDAPTAWARLEPRARFDCARIDPDFCPEDALAGPGRAFVIIDRGRGAALHLDATVDGLAFRGRGGVERLGASGPVVLGDVDVRLDGRVVRWRRGADTRALGRLASIAPAAVAANALGDVLTVDAASTHVALWQARR